MKQPKWQAALLVTLLWLAKNQSGQALREYALVIAIMSVATVITLSTVGLAIAGSLPASLDGLAETLERVQQRP
jgi:Flp pilus assembly pilin Flp